MLRNVFFCWHFAHKDRTSYDSHIMRCTCFSLYELQLNEGVLRPHRVCLHYCPSFLHWCVRGRVLEEVGKKGLQDKGSVSEVSMVLTRNSLGNYWLTAWFNWRQYLSPWGSHRQITFHLSLSHLSSYCYKQKCICAVTDSASRMRDAAFLSFASKESKLINQSRHILDV